MSSIETNRIENKRELTDSLEKEVVAFLNYREGGAIYIGIDNSGSVYGVSDLDGDMLKVKDRIKNNIVPSAMGLFDVSTVTRESKDIIKVTVASGAEKPYYIKKYGMSVRGCFIRIGTASEPMTQLMIDNLYSRRVRNSLHLLPARFQNLKFEQLKIYFEGRGLRLGDKFAENLGLLTTDNKYNAVAYLMSDNNGVSIKVAKYNGLNRVNLIENQEYGYESLVKATTRVLDKLELENTTFARITPKERLEKRLWNPVAVREAVINAMVHNDYSNAIPPKFEIFNDRLEITSSGVLLDELEKEDFFNGISAPKNPEIMRIFKDLGLVENLGSGIPRILEHYGTDSFNFMKGFIRMTFPKSEGSFYQNGSGPISGPISGPLSGPLDLSERQLEILEAICNNPKITRPQLAESIGINKSAIQRHIDTLKEKGYIERVGGNRGYWKITTID